MKFTEDDIMKLINIVAMLYSITLNAIMKIKLYNRRKQRRKASQQNPKNQDNE